MLAPEDVRYLRVLLLRDIKVNRDKIAKAIDNDTRKQFIAGKEDKIRNSARIFDELGALLEPERQSS